MELMGRWTSMSSVASLLALASIIGSATPVSGGKENENNETERYQMVVWDFHHVEVPYVICLWILLASLAKIGFHLYDRLSSIFPESCLLIVMGIAVGFMLHFSQAANTSQYVLDTDTFFLFLLPPIIYDAGYHMPLQAFFNNLGTILLLAVVNTLWNTAAIGMSLWAMSYMGWVSRQVSILHCFMFSALISAVDPVAVLAVFEDIHVNEMLYIIVFGESLLNDGVTVVLYHMMEGYTEIGEANLQVIDYIAGVGSFFIIAIGGTGIGIIYGLVGGFITKYTDHVKIIEPLFVFILGYLAYLTAEMMHLSGILALTFGGITMRHYVEANMSEQSVTTVKYTLKMMANISETVIFMFLGLSTVVDTLDWQWDFIFFSIFFCIIYRIIGIVGLVSLLNRRRLIRLTGIDQFIMSYGGLRGGIAFCLSLLIKDGQVQEKRMFVTTTIIVVFFTVFVQGITIKPVVNALKVKRQEEKDITMNEMLHERLIDHLMAGIEDIVGKTSHNSLKNKFDHFNLKFLKPLLLREKPRTRETSILSVFSRLNVRDALHHISSHGTFITPAKSSNQLKSSSSVHYLTSNIKAPASDVSLPPPRIILDIHSVEAVFTKKDVDDSRIHHLLEDAMFRPAKTFLKEKKHTLDEDQCYPISHRQLHVELHRLISLGALRKNTDQAVDTAMTSTEIPQEEEEEDELNKADEGIVFTIGLSDNQVDSGLSEEEEELSAPSWVEETEVERVLPWKRQTQLPPVPSSLQLSMPDDEHPLMSQAPSWADNLAYNHLTETGSPYVSPDNTISAPQPSVPRRPVFDIFVPSTSKSPVKERKDIFDSSQASGTPSYPPMRTMSDSHLPPLASSFPPPWASLSSEEPVGSPEVHDHSGGDKLSSYLHTSSHNFYPPSYHSCLLNQEAEGGLEAASAAECMRLGPNSLKHFHSIQVQEMASKQAIETELISEEASYQEGLVSRVQHWLDSSEPSDSCDEDFQTNNTAEQQTPHSDEDLDVDCYLDTYL